MKSVISSLAFLAILFANRAGATAPNESLLADMGLAGLHILNDDEAMHIRGHGFKPKKFFKSGKLEKFHQHVGEFRDRVSEFQNRSRGSGFKKGGDFVKSKAEFRGRLAHFKGKVH